jgi:hypothetical protein
MGDTRVCSATSHGYEYGRHTFFGHHLSVMDDCGYGLRCRFHIHDGTFFDACRSLMAEAKQARFPITANASDHARHLRTANI